MTHSKTVSDMGEVRVVGFEVRWSMGVGSCAAEDVGREGLDLGVEWSGV